RAQDAARYFSVMWCKASKKKHKRWEGDAVLVVRGRTATLKDMEGKDIGKGSGYKVSVLASLCEGETLMIGGKEAEVMGVISPEDFAKGRCFQDSQAAQTEPEAKSGPQPSSAHGSVSKPFCPPTSLRGDRGGCRPEEEQTCKPRHDPTAPGALVMPRPSSTHQWSNNKSGLPVVDVVMDPHLNVHLRPHQREGLVFLYECVMGMRSAGCHGAILADEMGLGKTLQSVALSWTLLKQGPYGGRPVVKRVLVVTPGSLVQNWGKEFNKWLGRERIQVFTVDQVRPAGGEGVRSSFLIRRVGCLQDHRMEHFVSSPLHSVLVISYEMLLRCLEQVQKVDFGLIVCDEGHRLKNSSIKTSSALNSLSCSRRVILTGTPVQNDLQEFYAIIEFVNPGILGSSTAYRRVYEEPILRSRQPSCAEEERVLGEERAAELSRLTGTFTLRRTQEIINRYLPPRLDWTLFCAPSPLQLHVYQRLLCHRVFTSCLQAGAQAHTHLACITALKKLCNHPALLYSAVQYPSSPTPAEVVRADRAGVCLRREEPTGGSEEPSFYDGLAELSPESYSSGELSTADSGKLLVLSELLGAIRQLSPSDRVVVVSNYTKTLDLLQDLLDGHMPTGQRQRLVDSFNSPFSQNFLFLLSSKAGGLGLNLVGASHLVLYDIDWNPANDIQVKHCSLRFTLPCMLACWFVLCFFFYFVILLSCWSCVETGGAPPVEGAIQTGYYLFNWFFFWILGRPWLEYGGTGRRRRCTSIVSSRQVRQQRSPGPGLGGGTSFLSWFPAGTIEERVFQRQVSKQGLSGTVVDLGKAAEHTSFSTNELRDLFSLTDTPCLTHDLLGCSCSMDGSVVEEERRVPDRPCQLRRPGDRGGVTQKPLSMSELMQWRHFSGDTRTFSDPYLDRARHRITFAFQT
ncbi:unnamed protein product, partial [Tetraodon nigroviridis]